MDNVFEYLLKINDPAELKLALVVLARSAGRQWVKISDQEISSLTGLSPGAIARGQKEMTKRGYVFRRCDEYKFFGTGCIRLSGKKILVDRKWSGYIFFGRVFLICCRLPWKQPGSWVMAQNK